MKKIIVKQEEISDCGVCSLLSIIRYYNGNVNLEELRIKTQTTNKGVNALNIIECAKDYGFDAKGIKTNKIMKEYLPCIAHIKINESLTHFVVIYEIKDNILTIMDPATGIVKKSINDFNKEFTNILLLFTPRSEIPSIKETNILRNLILENILKEKKIIIKILVITIFSIILSLIISQYTIIINYKNNIVLISLIFIILNIFNKYLNYSVAVKNETLYNRTNKEITSNYLNRIFKLPLKYLHIKDPAEISKRCEETSLTSSITISSIIELILSLCLIIPILIIILFINKFICILNILIIIITVLIAILFNRNTNKIIKDTIESDNKYHNDLIDYMYGLTSIKHSITENYIEKRIIDNFEEKNLKNFKYKEHVYKIDTLKTIIITTIKLLINIILIKNVINNNLKLEMFVSISYLQEIVIENTLVISNLIPNIKFVKNYINKINNFYNIPILKEKNINFQKGNIKIDNLFYSYNKSKNIIDNLSILIKEKDHIILKGESGRGKSTLCKLINKEYDDYKGKIYIGKNELSKINTKEIRNNINYVSQTEKIFSGTIKDNILLGRKIDDNKLNEILKICNIDKIIKNHPFGLDTFLISGGEELSGGERQLIILARALVRKFEILILDETLSELNNKLEEEIVNNIFKIYKDKTIIYVSHKNSENIKGKVLYV